MKGGWLRWGSAAVVMLMVLTLRCDPLSGVEGWGYDLALRWSAPAHSDDGVVVVATDGFVQHHDGAVWPRNGLQRLLARLDEAAPRAVALYWPPQGLSYPREVTMLAEEAGTLLSRQDMGEATHLLKRLADLSGADQRLAAQMHAADNLIMVRMPEVGWQPHWRWSWQALCELQPPGGGGNATVASYFASTVSSLSIDSAQSGEGDVVRRIPLLTRRSDGGFAATLSLQLHALRLRQDLQRLRFNEGLGLQLGSEHLLIDNGGYLYPRWSREALKQVALEDLLMGKASALEALQGKVVVAGPLHAPLAPRLRLATGEVLSPLEVTALTLVALKHDALLQLPAYGRWAQAGALLLVALLLVLLLPRLSSAIALWVGGGTLLVLLSVQLFFFLAHSEWLPLLTPAVALLLGLVLFTLRHALLRLSRASQQRLVSVTMALAQQLRQQGQLDEAHHHLQQCPADEVCDELYQLGLAYERKRQFNNAEQIFTQIEEALRGYRDAAARVKGNREARERIVIAGHPSSQMASTMVLDQSTLQKPVVGRYQIDRELGRGAMGMVYLGHDPKISRTVAIKTVSLAHEQDEQQLAQVRERFFREAESAGRLSHPHIVTIYDVGEEGDLAYIAMDYLKGVSLDHHCQKKELLPVADVMEIVAQVAEALDYAHEHGVIHRDIKPANIIYDRERREATVTDFGVAHLTDASKTRTGTVLGSPYYMAPEQLAGGKVDGRTDLFSLGVTFYQLLTGTLPFEADSIATLMYKIANSRHVSVAKLRRGVPTCTTRIVNQLLQKDAEKRFQRGDELLRALRRCLK